VANIKVRASAGNLNPVIQPVAYWPYPLR
jgi:hypothetical protein